MDPLPAILESMRLSLIAIVALAAFGFTGVSLMLFRQSQILRGHGEMLRDHGEMLRGHGQMLRDSQALLRDSEALVRETHALTAKAVAVLETVTRLVVHPAKRP